MRNVSYVGFEVFDSFEMKKIEEKLEGLLGKFAGQHGNENLGSAKIVYKNLGSRDDHTIEIKLAMETGIGTFRSEKIGHKPLEMVDEIVNDVEKQIIKKTGKMKTLQRPRNA
jgi:ribosome-associated translation inhibitor RaiA